MLTSTLRNVGGSVMVAIPKSLLEGLGLAANEKVSLRIDQGNLVIAPRPKPRYALADLIAECEPSTDAEWDQAAPIGREEIWLQRGDIWHVDLNPTIGREQANPRYVLILTPKEFNALGTPIVAPITQGGAFARDKGFAVSLSGAGTNAAGVVLCHQLRALDLRARNGRFAERVPDYIMDEVLARVAPLFE